MQQGARTLLMTAEGSMLSVDVELNRAETELQHEESALHTELARLAAVEHELEKRLKAVRAGVADAASAGARDPALEGRLKTTAVPRVDGEGAFSQARAAREAALTARRGAVATARAQVSALKQQLSALATQLQGDEKAGERLSGLARQQRREAHEAAVAQTMLPGAVPAVQAPPPPPPPPSAPPARKHTTRLTPPPQLAAQRHSPRVQMQAVVDLSSDNNFFNGFSSNISDGGLFVATVNLKPIGTEVDLTFTLPSGEKVTAHGVVRWVRMVDDKHPESFPGLGIQFTRLAEDAQVAIDTFVASREPMFYVE